MNNKGNLTDERPPLLPVIVGTGLGSGFWPWGPGTAGSVLATLIWTAMAYWGGISGTLCGTDLQRHTWRFLVVGSDSLGALPLLRYGETAWHQEVGPKGRGFLCHG